MKLKKKSDLIIFYIKSPHSIFVHVNLKRPYKLANEKRIKCTFYEKRM